MYLHPRSRNKNPYTKPHENEVLNEAHIYSEGTSIADTANFSLPASAITRIDINQKNIKATYRSHLVGGLIITSVVIGGVGLMISAMISSMAGSMFGGGSVRWF
jgi:hypothetical protein